ncbi:DUF2285 domain-containing protein [Mesorhizobium sp. M2A.F.Ca.ET.037.01.1.1]|nr:DUF2285 domain-containing protein [Mesorhizobium sp. M2A.F.Ca.ET.037.01.1.1]RUY08421.1 DUF2285 domain-containing protein [Mesorhizobium sp. M2A.F.Ca.ET.040.01.1.1]RWA91658.1 MAG: DUF2285 domain-containing protein [Mesorhizobium sp.]TIV16915.1 MAG: DUF2285 domain-containing protein [Mesorhizobium sp.]
MIFALSRSALISRDRGLWTSSGSRQAKVISPLGGFSFASSIESSANVFWSPRECPHVLAASAEPASRLRDNDAFDLSRVASQISILVSADEWQNVLFTEGFRNLQLAVVGQNVLEPARLTANVLWPPAEVKQRLKGLECLNALRSTGRLPPRFFPAEPRGARLRLVLRALDGFIAGASHREIGIALLGKARVERDWADPGDHLRDIVRRAIKRGRALMNGGYRRFLL